MRLWVLVGSIVALAVVVSAGVGGAAKNGRVVFAAESVETPQLLAFDVHTGTTAAIRFAAGAGAVAASPDGTRVAFTVEAGGGPATRLYVTRTDGSGRRKLIAYGSQPAWSPDGRTLAFMQYAPSASTERLTTLDLRTGHGRFIAEGNDIFGPLWSPDGKWIAFARSGDGYDIDIVHPDGSGSRHVAHSSVMNGYDWSPDSTRIVAADASGTGEQYQEQLVLFSIGGARAVTLTSDSTLKRDPHWSPAGREISYYAFPRDGSANAIFVVSLADGMQHRIGDGWAPSWSANGKRLAFLSPRGLVVTHSSGQVRRVVRNGFGAWDGTPVWAGNQHVLFTRTTQESRSRLMSVKPSGGMVQRLTPRPSAAVDPAWSPSGRLLAFVRVFPFGNREIEVMRADGSHVRVITQNRYGWDSQPSWSPDGRRVAFVRTDGSGHATLAVLRLSDRRVRTLPVKTYVFGHPAWSPDGQTIAVDGLRNTGHEGIRLFDLATGELSDATKGGGFDSQAVWSPDGKRIAFTRTYFGGSAAPNVVMVQTLGGEPKIVAHGNPWLGPPAVAWSPDGKRLVLAGMPTVASTGWEVDVIDPDGSPQAVLWSGKLFPTSVSWQPR